MLPIKNVITNKLSEETIIQIVARKVPSRVTDYSCYAIVCTLVTLSAKFILTKALKIQY